MTKEELREKANDLPLLPGVYLMMDKTGKVIYVGKAKKLKNRVSQYFQDTASHNEKTRAMVSQVDHFDTIFVSSEFEALILENSLIKRHQPRYNILLKDDKGYPFIRLDTGASYPRFTLAGKAEEDGARYFGPFGGRRETRLAIEAVCGALKLPICSRQFPRDIGRERPCLNHHIGRCDGFCLPGGPDQAEYRRRIRQAERIFSGHYRQLTAELQTEMEDAAEELNFEKAAALRDRIRAISVLGKQQQVIAGVCADTDVWGVYVGQVRSGCAVLHIEDGNLLGREVEVFPTAADEALPAVLAAVLQQYYLERGALPSEILLPEPVEDMETLAALLTGRAGHRVTLRVPQRGERAELLRMAGRNAREEVERITSDAERVNKTLEQLQQLADLPVLPRRMESYDISHTAGQDMVASMVVFADGKPLKRDYRRFQIKSLDHADDLRALQEVLQRRMQRYLDGDEHFSPLPDLLLMDGGRGQVSAAKAALAGTSLADVPLYGMVKDDHHRTRAIVDSEGREIAINMNRGTFTFITAIQDETHRFANAYRKQQMRKKSYSSTLTEVPGVGPKTAKALMTQFKSVGAVREATPDQLENTPGVGPQLAQTIYDYFHA